MTPRRYQMQARLERTEATRARLVVAARALLSSRSGIVAFTIDSVAKKARVSRMTVFHHFDSKTGLIEAVFDSLAIVGTGVPRLIAALQLEDPRATLASFVDVFAEVWQEDRIVIRRLQGLAALDPEFGRVWHRREERRREGLRAIVTRLLASSRKRAGRGVSGDPGLLTDTLYAIIAFETFDTVAGTKPLDSVAPTIYQLALAALGLDVSS